MTKEEFIEHYMRLGYERQWLEARWVRNQRRIVEHDRQKELCDERIAALAEFGIKANPGKGVAGSVTLYATEAGKLVKLLRRMKRESERKA